jgi:ABC-type hemin transport system substrate-binding protein
MRLARLFGTLVFLLLCVTAAQAQSEKKLTVTGKLTRVLAIGAETSGWAIQLDSGRTINGKQVSSIEVQSTNLKQLESLENQTVRASGVLSHVDGVETGPRLVLTINSIKAIKTKSEKET